jgi:hypothetical protein
MSITDKDRTLMEQVARYFESTAKENANDKKRKYKLKRDDTRSLNDTAAHFGITRAKAMKMLITMGVYATQLSGDVQRLRDEGKSIKEIATELGVSVGTVSSNLPYETEIHGNDGASDHAMAMREYRAYEKQLRERQIQNKKNKTNENKGAKEMSKDKTFNTKPTKDDWKKDLDSKLSFTETDSRRQRVTYEMIEDSEEDEQRRAFLKENGIELPIIDLVAEREALRKKLKEHGSLTPDEMLDLGEFPGALYDRNILDLEEIYGQKLPYEPREMIRLHLELDANFSEDEKEIMHKYGSMEGDTISRDILVSDDLPLYALHYVIQRAFGWENSHMHCFSMPVEMVEKLTKSVDLWMKQVGVVYRSPYMNEYAEFWADDYEYGSFKNWLRKKYTGPCVSNCSEEGLISSRTSLKRFDADEEYYVEYGGFGDGEVRPLLCNPVFDAHGNRIPRPKANKYVRNHRVEVVKARDLPVSLLNMVFERGAFDILERLTIGEVLAVRNMHCKDDFQNGDEISTYQEMLDDGMQDEIDEILESGSDSPMDRPFVYSFTDELLYEYDFGDSWKIKITGSRNCADLVESGKITQDMLDKSNIKARVTYRPVLLARDGEMLIDDVGGPRGFAEFIKDINTMKRGERDANGMTKTQLKEWAKSLGWHKSDSSDFSLL